MKVSDWCVCCPGLSRFWSLLPEVVLYVNVLLCERCQDVKHTSLASLAVCLPCVRLVSCEISIAFSIGALPNGLLRLVQACLTLVLGFGSLAILSFVQASPFASLLACFSVPSKLGIRLVFQSSVPSDFASLKNLSGSLSVPSSSPYWFAFSSHMWRRLRLLSLPWPQKTQACEICARHHVRQIICLY